ncbi:MAG: murein biosynthesis integral membrane protein MurJ [Deltaproteobacteria bacterium]|nr:MAG: murein biosynthesis integral membrane protein MurJ [Deltaproteobacteria bacterium]
MDMQIPQSRNISTHAKVLSPFIKLMGTTMLSRIFGFLREIVIAAFFGAGKGTDIFFVAFTIPTLFRRILGEEMVERAAMPLVKARISKGKVKEGWKLASTQFMILFILLIIILTLLYIFAPYLIKIISPGLSYHDHILALKTSYIVLPFMVIIGISSFFGAILLFFEKPIPYGTAPVMLSLGVISGIILFHSKIGIYAIAIGFILGGAAQLFFQLPFVFFGHIKKKYKFYLKLNLSFDDEDIKKSGKEGGWILLNSIFTKSVEVVDRIVASFLATGSISSLWYGQRLIQLPSAIFGLSLSRAIFPLLTENFAKDDIYGFKKVLLRGIKYNFFLMLPLTVMIILLSEPICKLVFERGVFNIKNTYMTSIALSFYAVGLIGISGTNLLSRAYSSIIKNKVVMIITAIGSFLNIILNITLAKTALRHGGIALASSISFIFIAISLLILINKEMKQKGEFIKRNELFSPFIKSGIASCVMGMFIWLLFPFLDNIIKFSFLKNRIIDIDLLIILLLTFLLGAFIYLTFYMGINLFAKKFLKNI